MLELTTLSRSTADQKVLVRRFPFTIGRNAEADFRIKSDGVWDRHLVIDLNDSKQVVVRSAAESFVVINGERKNEARLSPGDTLQVGSSTFRVGWTELRQMDGRLREYATFALILLITALQLWLGIVLTR
jgi:pSer/pThr/pTyr-binding forkhead associated (FHA) protein